MKISTVIQQSNDILRPLLWDWSVLAVILLAGANLIFRSGFFQFTRCKLWFRNTFGKLFSQSSCGRGGISPFQAVSTALVGSIGTGSIVEVTTALTLGGVGAAFWMWASALLGMMTISPENVLGAKYRIKNPDGTWLGGVIYYLEHGIHSKVLVVPFSVGCVLASLGMGNMAQSNSIAGALQDTPDVALPVTGLVLTVLLAIMTSGGIRRIVRVAECLAPLMAISYLFAAGIALYCHRQVLPGVFRQITDEAFGLRQAAGRIGGVAMVNTLKTGVSRGVLTNGAGLGSSAMAHSGSTLKEPVEQGMWGIFQVFPDTIIMCTVTALAILCSGTLSNGKDGAAPSVATFSPVFGNYGGALISVCIPLFVLATLPRWPYYGECGVRYLIGNRAVSAYRIPSALSAIAGCTLDLHLVWGISDIFSSLMVFPDLIALFLLSGEVLGETTNYPAKCRQKEKVEGKCRLSVKIRHSYSSHS